MLTHYLFEIYEHQRFYASFFFRIDSFSYSSFRQRTNPWGPGRDMWSLGVIVADMATLTVVSSAYSGWAGGKKASERFLLKFYGRMAGSFFRRGAGDAAHQLTKSQVAAFFFQLPHRSIC